MSSYNNENDWSVVKLAKRYGDTYGYWGYKANVYDTKSVNVVGYPINLTKTFSHIYQVEVLYMIKILKTHQKVL